MRESGFISFNGMKIPYERRGAVVVGSGAAAYSALYALLKGRGENTDFSPLLVTEGREMGTSRNTGSDKQTYYKLATGINSPDCAAEMARDYFSCGSMHGDLALTEATGSSAAFFRLVALGVKFPCDMYGEYTGYKTDHDPYGRASSCGPLTSKYMTEALEEACENIGFDIADNTRAVEVISKDGHACGIVCISANDISAENRCGIKVILSPAVVWAVGGPSALYFNSVYPESQTCALGAPLEAGASAANLTESQYGIASVKFRWNLSGSYQQVIPRYFSVDKDGNEREFLDGIFSTTVSEAFAQFSKGYEWPFDPTKLTSASRSSSVDMAVYGEIQSGRRVFMDFRRNPSYIGTDALSAENIGQTAYDYLSSCGALGETPIMRLKSMNGRAYKLYLSHGIDLEREPLEIGVCAQHMNGGLEVDINYENPVLRGFYPVGECAGVFGVKRPGGSALNSTQVSSVRAAAKILRDSSSVSDEIDPSSLPSLMNTSLSLSDMISEDGLTAEDALEMRRADEKKHDSCAAFIRDRGAIISLLEETKKELSAFHTLKAADYSALLELAINRDIMITRIAVLSAIIAYIDDGGLSRGSYLISGAGENTDSAHSAYVLVTQYHGGEARCRFDAVRPIPEVHNIFENVYNASR